MEGYCKGEICNRDGCKGIIEERDRDGGCSCHSCPPCSYCTDPKEYCPECDWTMQEESDLYEAKQRAYWDEYHKRPEVIAEKERQEEEEQLFIKMYSGKIPVDKYRCKHRGHTHFSQILYGVHPKMSMKEIEKDVRGSFGGRFTRYTDYNFEYVAYTD